MAASIQKQDVRNAEADLARQLMRLCVGFDLTQDQVGDPPAPSASFAARLTHTARDYLGTNEDEWLFTRPIALDLLENLGDGAIMLYGERGTGKSSLLRSIWRSTNPDVFRGHLALIDLHYIEARVNNMPSRARKAYIRNHIFGQLRIQVLPRAYDPATEAFLNWTLVSQRPEFEPFLAFLDVRGRQPAFTSAAELAALLDADPEFRESFDQCHIQYKHMAPRRDQDMERLQAFAQTPAATSTVVAFDNVDRLDPESQTDVASIARSISASTKYQLPIVLSCRTENLAQLREIVDTIKAVSIPCSPLPTKFEGGVIGWDVREIFQLRIDVLASDRLWSTFSNNGLDDYRLSLVRKEVALLTRRIKEAFDLVWVDKIITSGDSDDPLIELVTTLTEWHNGSIRTIAFSLFDLIVSMTTDPQYLQPQRGTAERRLRNLIYRHVLFYPAKPPSWEDHANDRAGASLSPSVTMFGARPELVDGNRPPFFFTRYRLLRFLYHKGTRQPLASIYSMFRRYGVDEESVGAALRDLTGETGGYPLVRIERLRSLEQKVRERQVEALPAGVLLARSLCFTCEYLYWSAVTTRSMDAVISGEIDNFERIRVRPPADTIKVRVAALFLIEYLMPRFRQEHPYLVRPYTASDRARLLDFRRDFGFDRDRWFIDRAVESIRAYARRTGVTIPATIDDQLSAVQTEGHRLTRMLD